MTLNYGNNNTVNLQYGLPAEKPQTRVSTARL